MSWCDKFLFKYFSKPDAEKLYDVGTAAADKLKSVHGTEYTVGGSNTILCKYIS